MTQPQSTRNVYFYDVKAFTYPAEDRNAEIPTDIHLVMRYVTALRRRRDVDESAYHRFQGMEMLINVLHHDREVIAGHFARIRREGLPRVISNEQLHDLALSDDEDVYEASHFVYFVRDKVMAIEYSQHAPRHKAMEAYLVAMARKADIPMDRVDLRIKLNQDTIDRLLQMGPVVKLEATVISSQARNMRVNRLSQALTASAAVTPFSATASIRVVRPRPARGRPRGLGPRVKAEVIQLLDAVDILETLKVWAEPREGGRPVLVDFKQDKFTASLPVRFTAGRVIDSQDLFGTIIDYYNVYVVNEAEE